MLGQVVVVLDTGAEFTGLDQWLPQHHLGPRVSVENVGFRSLHRALGSPAISTDREYRKLA